ncbi:unnamed protein product, partial [Linum tenue]
QLHLLDSLKLGGLHTKSIPSCRFWWKQTVERAATSIPVVRGRYDIAAALLSREEIASRRQLEPAASAAAASSSAPPPDRAPLPTAEWWETEDLTSLSLGQLKVLGAGIDRHMGKLLDFATKLGHMIEKKKEHDRFKVVDSRKRHLE